MLGVTPPPPGARFHGEHPKLGKPVHIAEYADGVRICAYLDPADPAIGKDAGRRYLPWLWGADVQVFVQRALPEQPRPLYRADNLERHPDWPVYIFEREDMVDAFHTLSGDEPVIATTCPGGAAAFTMGEWDALAGRDVILWPTHTTECELAMQELARQLDKHGATVSVVVLPQTLSPGFSLLSAIASAWTWAQVEDFTRHNRHTLEKQVVPIRSAHLAANGAGEGAVPFYVPPEAELAPAAPRREEAKQPATQIIAYRDAWNRIPGLTKAPNGTPHCHMANVIAVIDGLKGRYGDVWYDEFHCKVFTDTQHPRPWEDGDTLEFTHILQAELGFAGMRPPVVKDAIDCAAKKRRRHEVREWLEALSWDQSFRLALAPSLGWGTEVSPYTSSVFRCFLTAAVARIYRPGCKVDYVPVFEARQGARKTTSLETLFGSRWFDNPTAFFGEKDFLQNMNGKWCLELGELANIKGRALEIVNATITRTVDTYRASYGRTPGTYARQCVFAGTIDRKDWNKDEAGGRRWWPLACGRIDLDWIGTNREQLFAEAVYRFKDAQPWWDVPDYAAQSEQQARVEYDGWTQLIADHLRDTKNPNIRIEDVLAVALKMTLPEKWTDAHQRRARRSLHALGWSEQPDHTWKPNRPASGSDKP